MFSVYGVTVWLHDYKWLHDNMWLHLCFLFKVWLHVLKTLTSMWPSLVMEHFAVKSAMKWWSHLAISNLTWSPNIFPMCSHISAMCAMSLLALRKLFIDTDRETKIVKLLLYNDLWNKDFLTSIYSLNCCRQFESSWRFHSVCFEKWGWESFLQLVWSQTETDVWC